MARPVHRLRGMLFATAFVVGTLGYITACFVVLPFGSKPLRRVVRGWSRHQYRCARWILGVRVRVEGIDRTGPGVLVAMKHEARFETIDVPRLLGEPMVFAKQELFTIPLWGRLAQLYGIVPVNREGGAATLRGMLRIARAAQAEGRGLVIFAEGTRVPHGEAPPLQSGFAGLYRALGLPVVPVAVDSGLAFPDGGLVGQPATITYRFGEPIPPGLPRDEIEARVHEAINVLNPTAPAAEAPAMDQG